MDKCDVLIVGGGIAGLSAAVALCSESDLKVILVEREKIGSNRTTPAVFWETVREFGLEESVLAQYTGFIHHSPLGAYARFDFGRTVLAGLDYQKACDILYKRAVDKGLAFVKAGGADFSPPIPDPKRPLVVGLDTGDRIQAEVLIDASGHAQWSAKLLHIETSAFFSHCFGELLAGCLIEEPSSFRFLGPTQRYGNGGGWLYPTGKESASIGYSRVVPDAKGNIADLISGYEAAKREFRPYSEWVKSGLRERVESGIVPVGRIGRFCTDRILIVGDAAGQAHPWVVEGCRPALQNGRLCARVVLGAFASGRFDRSFLLSYERQWNKANRERFWRTASVAELTWNQSDAEWDNFIRGAGKLSPEQMLLIMRDNRALFFHKAYAVAGYIRRRAVKWMAGR
jgi:flavin-dependent dehydrogenase